MTSEIEEWSNSRADDAFELRIDCRSIGEWQEWRQKNAAQFHDWRNSIISAVKSQGLEEPISHLKQLPAEISINHSNLRESIAAGELNSRKRAGLLVFEMVTHLPNSPEPRQLKILGAEAVTRTASILRERFPFFLGCEYLPSEDDKRRFFPIQNLDLNAIAFNDLTFDVFYSSDVFEHLPDLQRALGEIYRVLKPAGILVSAFPFLADREESQVRAYLDGSGEVSYCEPPEFHGNPVHPEDGSLVFSLPAWDVLDLCKSAGFVDAKMTLIASSRFGITANGLPGVFVLSALKHSDTVQRKSVFAASSRFSYHGPPLRKVIGIAAQPRSGTTVLASVLGVHSRIQSIYEPWNSAKEEVDLNKRTSLGGFVKDYSVDLEGKDILLVKETATDLRYLDRVGELLRSTEYPIERDLIVIVRNPFHTFLSEAQARKEWWGESGLRVDRDLFDNWAERTVIAYKKLVQLIQEFNAIIIGYGTLVGDEKAVPNLMRLLDVNLEPKQLEYERYVDKQAVRGDIGVARAPRPLTADSATKRNKEKYELLQVVQGSRYLTHVLEIDRTLNEIERCPVGRAWPLRELITELSRKD